MKYIETKLSFAELLGLLAKHTDFDKDDESYVYANLHSSADETLNSGLEGYPSFYYFSDIGGKKYVLEENEGNGGSLVYEVSEVDDSSEYPCEIVLRDTVGQWDGDANQNLALYAISVHPYKADTADTGVKIWIEFYYSGSTNGAPLDRYVRSNEVSRDDNSFEAHDTHEFETYADAQAWVDEAQSGTYYLNHGEVDRPKYTITG